MRPSSSELLRDLYRVKSGIMSAERKVILLAFVEERLQRSVSPLSRRLTTTIRYDSHEAIKKIRPQVTYRTWTIQSVNSQGESMNLNKI